jgi:hypothetical protein
MSNIIRKIKRQQEIKAAKDKIAAKPAGKRRKYKDLLKRAKA